VNHVDVDAVVHELGEELLGTALGLHKHQHGWLQPLLKKQKRQEKEEEI